MAPKRASTGGKAAASPAKKQRVAADPLLEACKPVLKVLKSTGAAEDATELLCAALPFALRAEEGSESRHAYQEKMIEVVATELANTLAGAKEKVAGIETQTATLENDKAQSTTVEEEVTARLAAKTKERDDATEATQKQQEVVNEAQKALAAAQASAASADGEKAGMEKDRDDFVNGLTELWEPLKDSTLPPAQWRQRDKLIKKLVDKMTSLVEPSLLAALPVALKLKADARPEFAQATVAHAAEVYAKHIEALKEKVDNFGAEITARATAVTEAEATSKAAQEVMDKTTEADIAAQNTWAEVAGEDKQHKAKMKAFAPTTAKLEKQLEKAKAEVAHLQEVFDNFEAIRPVSAVQKKVFGTGEEAAPAEAAASPAKEAAPAETVTVEA